MVGEKRVTSFSAKILKLTFTPHSHAWHPATDLLETDTGYIVRVEIAGLSQDDFSVNYDKNIIVVQGKRPVLDSKCAYNRMEIPYGDFATHLSLPDTADIRNATAEYENGFLTIRIPRTRPLNIKITPDKDN